MLTGIGFDTSSGKVTDASLRWAIYVPFATTETTGLLTKASDSDTVVDVPRDRRGAYHDQPPEKVDGICGGVIETSRLSNLSSSAGVMFPRLKRRVRVPESSMQKKTLSFLALAFLVQVVLPGATCQARAQAEKASYAAMAPLDQYLMPDRNSEIALARSAEAPHSIVVTRK